MARKTDNSVRTITLHGATFEVRPLPYKAVKRLHQQGVNLDNLKEEDMTSVLVETLEAAYPDEQDQARLDTLTMPEARTLFHSVMQATQEVEAKN